MLCKPGSTLCGNHAVDGGAPPHRPANQTIDPLVLSPAPGGAYSRARSRERGESTPRRRFRFLRSRALLCSALRRIASLIASSPRGRPLVRRAGERAECVHCNSRVLASGMDKHVRRCPAYLHKLAQEEQPYFSRDRNVGSDDDDDDGDDADATRMHSAASRGSSKEATRASDGEGDSRRLPRGEALAALVQRLQKACEASGVLAGAPAPEPVSTPACDATMAAQAAAGAASSAPQAGGTVAPFSRKHAEQQASIVGHMVAHGLVAHQGNRHGYEEEDNRRGAGAPSSSTPPVYVELGAGRGYLSHFLNDAYGPLDLLLVERKAYRFEAERSIKNQASTAAAKTEVRDGGDAHRRTGGSVSRLRVDIKDLDISGAEAVNGRDVVITGKHLCGAATDLALRCALVHPATPRTSKEVARTAPVFSTHGIAIATCCHHRCVWRTYVNKPFMRRLGFDAREFALLTRISSWACDITHNERGGNQQDDETGNVEAPSFSPAAKRARADTTVAATDTLAEAVSQAGDDHKLSKRDKAVVGGMAKTLLDTGRLAWLKEQGLEGRLVGYVDTSVSPENRLIVVARSQT